MTILYWKGEFEDARGAACVGKVFWDKATPAAIVAELRHGETVVWSDIVADCREEGIGSATRILRAKTIRAAKRRKAVLKAEVRS